MILQVLFSLANLEHNLGQREFTSFWSFLQAKLQMSNANNVGSRSVLFFLFLKEGKKDHESTFMFKSINPLNLTFYHNPLPNVRQYIVHSVRYENDLSVFSGSLSLLGLRSNL